MHGILQIFSLENGGQKIIDPGNVGMGFVPLLNEQGESIETRHNHVESNLNNAAEETFADGRYLYLPEGRYPHF